MEASGSGLVMHASTTAGYMAASMHACMTKRGECSEKLQGNRVDAFMCLSYIKQEKKREKEIAPIVYNEFVANLLMMNLIQCTSARSFSDAPWCCLCNVEL